MHVAILSLNTSGRAKGISMGSGVGCLHIRWYGRRFPVRFTRSVGAHCSGLHRLQSAFKTHCRAQCRCSSAEVVKKILGNFGFHLARHASLCLRRQKHIEPVSEAKSAAPWSPNGAVAHKCRSSPGSSATKTKVSTTIRSKAPHPEHHEVDVAIRNKLFASPGPELQEVKSRNHVCWPFPD